MYCVTPHFKRHKKTKQMLCLNYFCNSPKQNGGLKRVCNSTLNNGRQSYDNRAMKNICKFYFSGNRALK